MDWLWFSIFGTACVVTIGLALLSKDRANVHVAFAAAALWLGATWLWLHAQMFWMPLLDWGFGLTALVAWLDTQGQWAGRAVLILYLRLADHVMDQLTGHVYIYVYLYILNGLFFALLWVIAEPGGRHGIGRIRDLRRSRRRRHSLGSARREGAPE